MGQDKFIAVLDDGSQISVKNGVARGLHNNKEYEYHGHEIPVRCEMIPKNVVVTNVGIEAQGDCNIYFNEHQVYWFPFTNSYAAVEQLQRVLHGLKPLHGLLRDRKTVLEKVLKRNVYYREIPAIIDEFQGDQGRVLVRADNLQHRFPVEPWLYEIDYSGATPPQPQYREYVDILNPHLWWDRKEEESL